MLLVDDHAVVEVWSGGPSGRADACDDVAACDTLPLRHEIGLVVRVDRHDAVAVIGDQEVAYAALTVSGLEQALTDEIMRAFAP